METGRPSSRTIDRRRAYGLALRRLMSGRLTNFQYEREVDEIERRYGLDDAVWTIYREVWPMYCDVREHRLTGRDRPDRATRRVVAERIVFLYSGRAFAAERSGITRGGRRDPRPGETESEHASGGIETTLFALRWLGHCTVFVLGGWVMAALTAFAAAGQFVWGAADGDEDLRIDKTTPRVGWYGLRPSPWPFDSVLDRERVLAQPHACFGEGGRG